MAVQYPAQEDQFFSVEEELYIDSWRPTGQPGGHRLDGLSVAAVVLLFFLGLQLVRDRSAVVEQVLIPESSGSIETEEGNISPALPESVQPEKAPVLEPIVADPATILFPYDEYWLTQGPHGFSYGHMAIDLSAGKGTAIKSPIHGTVVANYFDEYGNTTLLIENDRYQVTLLHGNYTVTVGQAVSLADIIGSESNKGYTTDMYGNSCRGRDCGYHTHLNVFDLQLGQNVNPLDVLSS